LVELTKINLVLQSKNHFGDAQKKEDANATMFWTQIFALLSNGSFIDNNIDYVFKFLKSLNSQIKKLKLKAMASLPQELKDFSSFIITKLLPYLMKK